MILGFNFTATTFATTFSRARRPTFQNGFKVFRSNRHNVRGHVERCRR